MVELWCSELELVCVWVVVVDCYETSSFVVAKLKEAVRETAMYGTKQAQSCREMIHNSNAADTKVSVPSKLAQEQILSSRQTSSTLSLLFTLHPLRRLVVIGEQTLAYRLMGRTDGRAERLAWRG